MNKDFDFLLDGGPNLPDIKSVCLSCCYEETVPDFIYDEMGSKEKHKELKTKRKYQRFTATNAVNIKQYQKIG